ncbi:hypothetical protein HNQ91_001994 [Filimonas zeae]|uniref:Uncharacterized protein n=1 Tax=Filimonas zeae TaxID=1737353 RepID=A0A917IVJ6_9BACT|nr:hypothetical protein [Filimonas zeae]MDR6338943.1 hypothetical protein [Filimonas zeae]GGH65845.1 hypothetical protein GCM10011379_19420 [Filimonas zeae]
MYKLFVLLFTVLLFLKSGIGQEVYSCDTSRSEFEEIVGKDMQNIIGSGAATCLSLYEGQRGYSSSWSFVFWVNKRGKSISRLYYNVRYVKGKLRFNKKKSFLKTDLSIDKLILIGKEIAQVPGDTLSDLSHDHVFRIDAYLDGKSAKIQFCEKQWLFFTSKMHDRYFDDLIAYLRGEADCFSN